MLINVRLAFWVVNFAKKINVAKIGNPDTCLAARLSHVSS